MYVIFSLHSQPLTVASATSVSTATENTRRRLISERIAGGGRRISGPTELTPNP